MPDVPIEGYNERYIQGKQEVAKRFHGVKHEASASDRLPPGQHLISANTFPVLDLGVKPDFDPEIWTLKIGGAVEKPMVLTWKNFQALPHVHRTLDFHCVTRWTRYDIQWDGVLFSEITKLVQPKATAKFVIQKAADGYDTNVPLADLMNDECLLADTLDGKLIPREHGWPVRIVNPHLYGWKGAKFLNEIEFVEQDKPGFWEVRGYNDHGDPWKEERYS